MSVIEPRHPLRARRLMVAAALLGHLGLRMSTAEAAYPLVVDDAGVLAPGESEWVLSGDSSRGPAAEAHAARLGVTAGLWSGFDGSVGFGYGWLHNRAAPEAETRDGVLDATIGLKASIAADESRPSAFALSATLKVPTASEDKELGSGEIDGSVLGIATWTWGSRSLDINAGYTWTALGDRAERAGDAWSTGAALRWQANERLLVFGETFALWSTDRSGEPVGELRAGFQVEVRPGLLLATAVGIGLGPWAPDTVVTFGMTITF